MTDHELLPYFLETRVAGLGEEYVWYTNLIHSANMLIRMSCMTQTSFLAIFCHSIMLLASREGEHSTLIIRSAHVRHIHVLLLNELLIVSSVNRESRVFFTNKHVMWLISLHTGRPFFILPLPNT